MTRRPVADPALLHATAAAARAALARRQDNHRTDAPYEWTSAAAAARFADMLASVTITVDEAASAVIARAERHTGMWGYAAAEILDSAADAAVTGHDVHITHAPRGGWRLIVRPQAAP